MLENILQMVREFGQQEVVENPAVPNEKNEAVMAEASHAVAGTLQKQVASGNLGAITDLFKDSDQQAISSSPVTQDMQSGFIENITSKLGISKNVAAGLAASFIPMILGKLVHRTNSTHPADSAFSLDNLVSSLSGGLSGHGFGNLLNQFTGNSSGGINPSTAAAADQNDAGNVGLTGGLGSIVDKFFGK